MFIFESEKNLQKLKSFFKLILIFVLGHKQLQAQGVFNQYKQLGVIPQFYTKYSELYAKDFFNSYLVGHSLNTFAGAQILYSGAWALELRAGMPARLPSSFNERDYTELNQFKSNIKFLNGMPRTTRASELPNPSGMNKILFTLNDSSGNPLNSARGGQDSVQWYLPSLDELGVNKTVSPTYNFILHWAPGYAFEFAGTFVKYDGDPTTDNGNSSRLSTRYYNIYFAHDVLYWFQGIHVRGWHLTPSIELSDYSQGVYLNTQSAKLFNDYSANGYLVKFKNSLDRVDFYARTMRYGINAGKSFSKLEVWGGVSYIASKAGMSDNGFVSALIDEKPADPNNGFRSKRYREFFFTGINDYRLFVMSAGASLGQKRLRIGAQYNILSNGYHHASISLRVVFRDNNRHPWQTGLKTEEYFDPTKRKTVRKTVVIERDEED